MVVGTLRIPVSADRRAAVLEVLRSIQGPVLAQPGCKACHIYEEQGPEQALVLVERWTSGAALEGHLRSEAYRRILNAIELSGGPPEVCFDYVSATEGMELIERSRNPEGTCGPPSGTKKPQGDAA
jgi:quinol monooxygenase YgiN